MPSEFRAAESNRQDEEECGREDGSSRIDAILGYGRLDEWVMDASVRGRCPTKSAGRSFREAETRAASGNNEESVSPVVRSFE